jgi:hypothetical protein
MWNWTKKKLGYRKDIEDLKGKYNDKINLNYDKKGEQYIQERINLFFNPNIFYPIIDRDKRYIGRKNINRMLVRIYQRYNYYCSRNKFSNKDRQDRLCDEDIRLINEYHKKYNYIQYDDELDIYKNNDNYKTTFLNSNRKNFNPQEFNNIFFYFGNVESEVNKNNDSLKRVPQHESVILYESNPLQESDTLDESKNTTLLALADLEREKKIMKELIMEKKNLVDILSDYGIGQINGVPGGFVETKGETKDLNQEDFDEIEKITKKIYNINDEIEKHKENITIFKSELAFGGRKKRRKTTKRKNNKKRRKTRKY